MDELKTFEELLKGNYVEGCLVIPILIKARSQCPEEIYPAMTKDGSIWQFVYRGSKKAKIFTGIKEWTTE